MMFRGTPKLSAAQLADISAAMGGDFDADTQQTVTQYFFTVPAEDLEVALHLEAARMRGVLDTNSLWNKERGAIEQEVSQDLSSPQYVVYTELVKTLFEGTPYEHDSLGTRASFDKTTGKMLKAFYKKWYAPNNAILVIAGDVRQRETIELVKRLFGDIPSKKIPAKPQIHLQPVTARTLHLNTDLPYGLVAFSFRVPGFDNPDYAAVQVLADVLSSQRSSLYDLVAQGKALYTGFDADSLPAAGMGSAMAAFPAGADTRVLIGDLKSILSKIVKHGVPPDLVKAAKLHEALDAELQKNSISGLADIWSQAVAIEGRESPDEDINAINKVTVADVNRVAAKYLNFHHAVIAIMTPQASGKPIATKGYGGKESFAPRQTKPVTLPKWAKTALKKAQLPPSTVNPVDVTLVNGLRLIIQPESVSNTVNVYGHLNSRPELQAPKGKFGVDQVLEQLFSYGSQSLDRVAFQKALDDIGADASAGSDFELQVSPRHFEKGIQLLADNELHPALPESAFKIIREQAVQAVAGQLKSPQFLVDQALHTGLFPQKDPTLRHATPVSVKSLTHKDVTQYYKNTFRPDLTTIVIIGNIKPIKAQKIINKYFGAWHANGPKPSVLLPPVPANKPADVTVPNVSRVQDKVILAQTVDMTHNNPDYYALKLGNHVLGGAFYATRLYRDLREESGLVYYVGVSMQASKTRAVYSADFACDLRTAKSLMLREITLSQASVDSIAHGFIRRSTDDLPLNEPVVAAQHYIKLKAHQVKAAFAKWLRPEDWVQITEGPRPE
jgi:zinc protease